MLPGSRSAGVLLCLVVLLSWAYKKKLRLRASQVIGLLTLVLLPAILVESLKRGEFSEVGFTIVDRIVGIPIRACLEWLRFAEVNGFWGPRSVRVLALIFGESPENVPQFMFRYLIVRDGESTSGSFNVTFVFSYYTYFGIYAFPAMVALVLGLDAWLEFYRRLPKVLCLPALAVLNLTTLSLTQSDFLRIFLSDGLATGSVILVFIGYFMSGGRISRTRKDRALGGVVARGLLAEGD